MKRFGNYAHPRNVTTDKTFTAFIYDFSILSFQSAEKKEFIFEIQCLKIILLSEEQQ